MLYKSNKILKILGYIFFILTIFNCGSVYGSKVINFLWIFVLFIIFIIALLNLNISEYKFRAFIIFDLLYVLFTSSFLIVNRLLNPFNLLYFILLLVISPSMLIVCFMSFRKYISYIFNILKREVLILSIISLFFWILSLLGLSPNMDKFINWGGMHSVPGYFGLDFLSQGKLDFLGIFNIYRNTGIFCEAPMFSYVLCIILLINLFLSKSNKIFSPYNIIILFTIFSTTSTTGVFIECLAVLYKCLISFKNKKIQILSLAFIPIVILFIKYLIDSKMGDIYDVESSYNIRKNDIITCIYAWKNHILFGNGIYNRPSIEVYNGSQYHATGLSTGLFSVLAYGGIVYSLLYIIPTMLAGSKSLKMFGFAVFTFILFIYTIVSNSYLYIIILAYFWFLIIDNVNISDEKNYIQ